MAEEKKEMTIEEHFEALDEIVKALEGDGLSLEESLAAFEKGVAHVKEANGLLSQMEEKLKVLSEDGSVHDF